MAEAIERRNRLVHSTVEIGEVWREYADGSGGEWVHVITAMGEDDCDEHDLRSDLALQQQATCERCDCSTSLRSDSVWILSPTSDGSNLNSSRIAPPSSPCSSPTARDRARFDMC